MTEAVPVPEHPFAKQLPASVRHLLWALLASVTLRASTVRQPLLLLKIALPPFHPPSPNPSHAVPLLGRHNFDRKQQLLMPPPLPVLLAG
jgi:hypothetical protein